MLLNDTQKNTTQLYGMQIYTKDFLKIIMQL